MPVQRYKITIAYRGTPFHGWQKQPPVYTWKGDTPAPGEGIPTVQEALCRAPGLGLGPPDQCGRFVANGFRRSCQGPNLRISIPIRCRFPPKVFACAVNHRLPPEIVIHGIKVVPPSFDAILSTVSKRYQYFIWNAPIAIRS